MPSITAEISESALDTLRWLVEQTESSEAGILESAINNYRRQFLLSRLTEAVEALHGDLTREGDATMDELGDDLQLSKKDRLLLMLQYKILAKLDSEYAELHERNAAIVENGCEHDYHELLGGFPEPIGADVSDEVLAILQMFLSIQESYHDLEDTSGIDEWQIQFLGFDGASETDHMRYARFVIEQGGPYSEIVQNDRFDSHVPMLKRYRDMLIRYSPSGEPIQPKKLTKEGILGVIGQAGDRGQQ